MIFNNELEENIDNLTSQIPILRKMVETIDAKINKTGAKYIPGLAYWEIESMSGQVMNYRELIKKIGQAVTHIAKVQEIEQVSSLQEAGSAQAQEVEEEITFATALDRALFKQALRKLCDSRKELRCEGVKIIEQLGYKSKAVIPILIHILHDADGDVRTHVLGSLMKLEAQEALPRRRRRCR